MRKKIVCIFIFVILLGMIRFAYSNAIMAQTGLKDIIYKGKTKPDAVFKHTAHTTEPHKIACRDCHPGIFKMKQGTSGMTMDTINNGEHCGKCHNGAEGFDAKDQDKCSKCHIENAGK